MNSIMVPTRAWAAMAWTALAVNKSDPSPVMRMVKMDYTPGVEGSNPPRLTVHATDRFRVHRVIIDLPVDDNADQTEPWTVIVPATLVVEASKHPSVGKVRIPLIPLTLEPGRIGAGYEGWGAAIVDSPGNFPPVGKLFPDTVPDATVGPIMFRTSYLADLAKYTLGGRSPDDSVWAFTWTATENPNKPGPMYAYRRDDGISAVALIQPNMRPR